MLIVYDMDKQKILIVGHATYTMSAFIGFLIDGPHEVFTAPDGREGLEILRQEQIDLAIAEMYVEGPQWYALCEARIGRAISDRYLAQGKVWIPGFEHTRDRGCKCVPNNER